MTFDINQPSIQNLYQTPLLRQQLPNTETLNNDLLTKLLSLEYSEPYRRSGTAQKSNIAGWRSDENLLTLGVPSVNTLTKHVANAITFLNQNRPLKKVPAGTGVDMFAWANINRSGEYNSAHIHPGFHWGAVYFVSTGEADKSQPMNGLLEFHDPRPAAGMMVAPGYEFGNKFSITPKEGMLVVFPSWLVHSVHPFFGKGARVSIAFNIKIT